MDKDKQQSPATGPFVGGVLALTTLLGAVYFGSWVEQRKWDKDCGLMGQHRSGGTVFICMKKEN